jgi:hypothetical protein
MRFQLLAPIVSYIDGDNLKEAIKIYVKQNYAQQINNLIVADNIKRYNAAVRYYKENAKNKIGLRITEDVGYSMYPSNSFIKPLYKSSEYDNGAPPTIVNNMLPLRPIVAVNPYVQGPIVGVNPYVQNTPIVGVNSYLQTNPLVGINSYYRG